MAHSKTRANDGKITYPPGVKEISDKISKEEMVRRLKVSKQVIACRWKFIVKDVQWSCYYISRKVGFYFFFGLYLFYVLKEKLVCSCALSSTLSWNGLFKKGLNAFRSRNELHRFQILLKFYFSYNASQYFHCFPVFSSLKESCNFGNNLNTSQYIPFIPFCSLVCL